MGSELRQFSHSGLFEKLLQSGWRITVLTKIDDEDIRSQLDPRIQVEPLPSVKIGFFSNWVSVMLDKAHAKRRQRQGKSGWRYGVTKYKNWREALLARTQDITANIVSQSELLVRIGRTLERWLICHSDRSHWKRYLQQQQIDAILVNLPRQPYWDKLLSAAAELGVQSYLVYHTWKDLTTAGRLNHRWTGIGVWNSGMKSDLLAQNHWVPTSSVHIVGCGHFDCIGRSSWLSGEEEFRSSIGVLPNSALVIYPTSGPGIVPEEDRYIALVADAVRKAEAQLQRSVQIVFRMNPMDDNSGLEEKLRTLYPEYPVLRPEWKYIRKKNWCYGHKSDTIFYNALLAYASACVCIPSTVTLDCAINDLPIINLGIEVPGKQPLAGSIRSFWEVDFYRNVRDTRAADWVTSTEELYERLVQLLNDHTIGSDERKALVQVELDGIAPGQSSELSCAMINQAGG